MDGEYKQVYKATLPAMSEQFTELTKAFSFWPSPDRRVGGNIYDIRSYSLKPGSMYDWSNYWARGIQYRSNVRPDIPYAGLFTQLGSCTPSTTSGATSPWRTGKAAERPPGITLSGMMWWPTPSPWSKL